MTLPGIVYPPPSLVENPFFYRNEKERQKSLSHPQNQKKTVIDENQNSKRIHLGPESQSFSLIIFCRAYLLTDLTALWSLFTFRQRLLCSLMPQPRPPIENQKCLFQYIILNPRRRERGNFDNDCRAPLFQLAYSSLVTKKQVSSLSQIWNGKRSLQTRIPACACFINGTVRAIS